MNLKTIALLSSFILSINAWGSCLFVKDTNTDAAELKGKTVRTADGEFEVNSVSRTFQLHSSGRFAVCNRVRLELSSIDGEDYQRLTFSTNSPYGGMAADHLLAAMEDRGVYLTESLTVEKSGGQVEEVAPNYTSLVRSHQLSVCLGRGNICSY